MTDIRELLRRADGPSDELDFAIATALGEPITPVSLSRNYTDAVRIVEAYGYDWVMGNVNGHVGGTPYARVGSHDEGSFSATPLLSLWLSFFRLELGDEREAET